MVCNQWVLEYNKVSLLPPIAFTAIERQAVFKAHSLRHLRPVNAATMDQWHEMMGHLYLEALTHLQEHCQGVRITTSELTKYWCEDCCIGGAKRVLYRYPVPRYLVLFGKVYWDLVQLPNGFGGEHYILHFVDSYSRMHYVYSLLNKN